MSKGKYNVLHRIHPRLFFFPKRIQDENLVIRAGPLRNEYLQTIFPTIFPFEFICNT